MKFLARLTVAFVSGFRREFEKTICAIRANPRFVPPPPVLPNRIERPYRDAADWIELTYRAFPRGFVDRMKTDPEFRAGKGAQMASDLMARLPAFRDLLLRCPADLPELYADAAEKAQWLIDEVREFI